ncbi:MAG: tRNA adenosine(34) deaminase TadA [Bdellovibrionales bacterium]|nr:tRNA adenosine(34) deaminase TadA [Bdellovibrionales bacterium]
MGFLQEDIDYMKQALALADQAAAQDEVPVGAIVVFEGQVVGRGLNHREGSKTALGHAEVMAMSEASKALGRWRLSDCTLYVTLEPCLMCAGAMQQARLGRLVFGAHDPKGGAVKSLYEVLSDPRLNHQVPAEGGLLEEECGARLSDFFRKKRASTASSRD